MAAVAQIAVEKTVFTFDKLFSYAVPEKLCGAVRRGVRVLVPFGRGNRLVQGMVFSVETGDAGRLKAVVSVLDAEPVLDENAFGIVRFMADTTFCSYYDAVRCLIPAGLSVTAHESFAVVSQPDRGVFPNLPEDERALLRLMLQADSRRETDMLFTGPGASERIAVARKLAAKGIVKEEPSVTRKVGDKLQRLVKLAPGVDPDGFFTPKQQEVLRALAASGPVTEKEAAYNAGASESVVKALLKKGALVIEEKEMLRTPRQAALPPREEITLSEAQESVFRQILSLYRSGEATASLLFGVTGSGKTSVFIKLIEAVLADGKQVILMVPEIALTPQMLGRFRAQFGDQVAVIHSDLSAGERLDEDKRIRSGDARIVIGTRSSVFAPCRDLGMIIMDEEGEHSYKSDSTPRYHAREIAKLRCVQHKAALLLASATPSVESYYAAEKGRYHLFTLPGRYGKAQLPEVKLINMLDEERNYNFSPVSDALGEALLQTYERGEQSIVLINRRGYATFAVCLDCGEAAKCPNCSVTLTYHKANGYLMCHYCGYTRPAGAPCAACGSTHMRTSGTGTQRAEDIIARQLPSARILRMDTDTTTSRYAYEEKFARFEAGEYDIMIGTQMVAKGLNFPGVTLVGVLGADQYLYSGDFRSGEKTFSLITQVVGRSGRFDKPGAAYIQTVSPEHPVIQDAARQDYVSFYRDEIAMRRAALQPPFCDLAVIGFSGADEGEVRRAADGMHGILARLLTAAEPKLPAVLLGVSEAGVYRVNGRFRLRIILKCKNNRRLRALLRQAVAEGEKARLLQKASIYIDMNGEI